MSAELVKKYFIIAPSAVHKREQARRLLSAEAKNRKEWKRSQTTTRTPLYRSSECTHKHTHKTQQVVQKSRSILRHQQHVLLAPLGPPVQSNNIASGSINSLLWGCDGNLTLEKLSRVTAETILLEHYGYCMYSLFCFFSYRPPPCNICYCRYNLTQANTCNR